MNGHLKQFLIKKLKRLAVKPTRYHTRELLLKEFNIHVKAGVLKDNYPDFYGWAGLPKGTTFGSFPLSSPVRLPNTTHDYLTVEELEKDPQIDLQTFIELLERYL